MEEALKTGFLLKGKHDYTIVKKLSQGGFGITYLAEAEFFDHHISQKGVYAIKEFFPHNACGRAENGTVIVKPEDTERFNLYRADFKKEADRLYELHHEGIVPVNEVIEANGTIYYVMKYLGGLSLTDYVHKKGGHLDEATARDITSKVAAALAFLHERKINHLDVKPDNIMMAGTEDNPMPVLIDFGLSKHFRKDGRQTSMLGAKGCSEGFSPLEQYAGISTFSPEADVYALGATCFYMLTGKAPLGAADVTAKWIYTRLPDGVSEAMSKTLVDAMAKTKDLRIHSIDDFIARLGGKGKPTQELDYPFPSGPSRHLVLKWLGGLVFIALLGAALFFFLNRETAQENPSAVPEQADTDSAAVTKSDSLMLQEATAKEAEDAQEEPSASAGRSSNVSAPSEQPSPSRQEETAQSSKTAAGMSARHTPVEQPVPAETTTASPAVSSGQIDLGYAVWNGEIKDGKPDGRGTLTFRQSHVVDSRDAEGHMADAGDRLTGKFSKGHLEYGTLVKTSGEKMKIAIGR